MTCDRAVRLIEKLADGEAKPGERSEAEAHLEQCEDCREHYQFVRALETASETIEWPEPPESYWQHFPTKVSARLERDTAESSRGVLGMLWTPSLFRLGAVAATLTLALAVGVIVLQNDELQPPKETAPATAGKRVIADEKSADAPADAPTPELVPGVASGAAPEPAAPAAQLSEGRSQLEQTRPSAPVPTDSASNAPEAQPDPIVTANAPKAAPAARAALERRDRRGPAEQEVDVDVAAETDEELQNALFDSTSSGRQNAPAVRSFAEAEPSEPSEPGAAGEAVPTEELGEVASAELASADAVPASARKEAPARALAGAANPCARWHDYLARNGDDGSESIEARYQIAVCSIETYIAEPSADALEIAERDTRAFLALEEEGERADRLRARMEEIRE